MQKRHALIRLMAKIAGRQTRETVEAIRELPVGTFSDEAPEQLFTADDRAWGNCIGGLAPRATAD